MAQNVKFISVKLQTSYDALEVKDSLALYWIQDTQRLYKGDKLYGVGLAATADFAGLMSAEDKVALDALVANGSGINNLKPVDGSIVITTDGNNATIGVGLSAVEGNMLLVKDDGLYVAEAEYTIEKQSTAEDGYSATYKLKKTIDGVSTYVGDAINIAKDMVLQGATLETVTEADVPYVGAVVGDPYIDMAFNDATQSHIYIPVKGLVDTYTAGEGIEIVDGKISVKIADNSHGLVAVDGVMTMLLATKDQDGAMSKEDKAKLDAVPYVYEARKYDISDVPVGTLVNYGENEIRIMCPNDAEFKKQAVGANGDTNTYYLTLKTYCPSDNVVGYIEHLGDQVDAEVLTDIKIDAYGRRYQPTWLGLAKYDEATGVWSYYGKNSTIDKFIGWDYQIDWYNADGVMIASDSIRINLSNEECHNLIRPYYGPNNDISTEIIELQETIEEMKEMYSWGEM